MNRRQVRVGQVLMLRNPFGPIYNMVTEVLICAYDGVHYYAWDPSDDFVYSVHPYMLMKP